MSNFYNQYKRQCQAWYRVTVESMRDLSVFLLHPESIDWGRETDEPAHPPCRLGSLPCVAFRFAQGEITVHHRYPPRPLPASIG